MHLVARLIVRLLLGILGLVLFLFAYLWFSAGTWGPVEEEKVTCAPDAPILPREKSFRVLSWNVQYLAGKNYIFFYDIPGNKGPHERPSSADIEATGKEVARVIEAEQPDFVLLQEVDEGAKRTDGEDQTKRIQKELGHPFPCVTETFYWKAGFVPHPRIMGRVGMKLTTLSRYRLDRARRHALPPIPADPLSMRLGLHRALFEARAPIAGGGSLALVNTHLDAFAQGTNIMGEQARLTKVLLDSLEKEKTPWILGGDFNLLPPGITLEMLHPIARTYYNKTTEIKPVFDSYRNVIPLSELTGPNRRRHYTLNANSNEIPEKPDRTIDYVFYGSHLEATGGRVRSADTMRISDHLPIVSDFRLVGR